MLGQEEGPQRPSKSLRLKPKHPVIEPQDSRTLPHPTHHRATFYFSACATSLGVFGGRVRVWPHPFCYEAPPTSHLTHAPSPPLKFRCMLMSGIVGCTKPQAASRPKIDPAGGTLWNQIGLRVCGPNRNGRLEQQLLMDHLHAEPSHFLFGASVSSVKQADGPDFPNSGTVNPGSFPVRRRIHQQATANPAFAFRLSWIFFCMLCVWKKIHPQLLDPLHAHCQMECEEA